MEHTVIVLRHVTRIATTCKPVMQVKAKAKAKDLTYKAKAKDLTFKAKAKAKEFTFKAKPRTYVTRRQYWSLEHMLFI